MLSHTNFLKLFGKAGQNNFLNHIRFSSVSITKTILPPFESLTELNVILITSDVQLSTAIDDLSNSSVIGFDTETKPNFTKDTVRLGPNLIQLATLENAYLFPITNQIKVDVEKIKSYLKGVLESEDTLKVGFGLGSGNKLLKTNLSIEVKNCLDMGKALRPQGIKEMVSMRVGVESVLQQRFFKNQKLHQSNWARELKHYKAEHKLYAGNKAYVGLKVYSEWIKTQKPKKAKKIKIVETTPFVEIPSDNNNSQVSDKKQ